MASLKSALPAHLKPSALGGNGNGNKAAADAEFAKKHHGKTQSHMVSEAISLEYTCEVSGEALQV